MYAAVWQADNWLGYKTFHKLTVIQHKSVFTAGAIYLSKRTDHGERLMCLKYNLKYD